MRRVRAGFRLRPWSPRAFLTVCCMSTSSFISTCCMCSTLFLTSCSGARRALSAGIASRRAKKLAAAHLELLRHLLVCRRLVLHPVLEDWCLTGALHQL